MPVRSIPISEITIPRGRREPMKGRIASIAQSIKEVGILHPIVVNEDYRLIAGRTRLEAVRCLGWKTIDATVLDCDSVHAELAEIVENIERSGLDALGEAQALKRMKEIYLALHPETGQGAAPGKAGGGKVAKDAESASFAEAIAEQTGMGKSTVQHAVTIAENLSDDAAEAIKGTRIADNKSELAKLSKLPEAQQVKAAKKIASGKAKTVKEATGKPGQQKRDPRLWKEIEGLFGKAINRTDELHKQYPNAAMHKTLIGQAKECLKTLKAWKEAAD